MLRLPLFLDEGNYIFWAKLVHENIGFAYISLQDGKTPLYIWLISLVNPLFHNYLFTGRIISVLAGGVTLISWTYIIWRFQFKNGWKWYWALMLTSPYLLLVEKMALADSLLTACASLSLLFWMIFVNRIQKSDRIKPLVSAAFLSGLILGIGFMVKSSARIFLVAQIAISVIPLFMFIWRKNVKKIIILLIGVAILFGTYREVTGYMRVGAHKFWSSISEKEADLTFPVSKIIKSPDLTLYLKHSPLVVNYFLVYIGPVLIFTFFGLYLIVTSRRDLLWILVYISVILAGVFLSGKVIASRYFYPSLPAILAISSIAVNHIWVNFRKGKMLVLVIILFAALQSLVMLISPLRAWYTSDDLGYFVTGDISALGLDQVVGYLKNKGDINVGVSGVWGVAEGSILILNENGIHAEKIAKVDQMNNTGNFHYLYLTSQNDINLLPDFEKYQVVMKFARPGSDINTYLLIYSY